MAEIVPAREEDLPRVLEIENDSISPPWTHGSLLGEIYRGDSYFALARESAVILGFCILRRVANEGEILQLAVDKNARRHGIADALMRSALDCAAESGIIKLFLEVRRSNTAAAALYKKHGFVISGRRKDYYDKPVEDAYVMVREL